MTGSRLSDLPKVTQIVSDQIVNLDKWKWKNGNPCENHSGLEVKSAGLGS